MTNIVTVTLNPAIDGACAAQEVRHTHKVRTTNERYDAGGGGINVGRVIQRLGGEVLTVYLAGGATGTVLNSLVDQYALPRLCIDIDDHTRISLAVHEASTGREYRFVPDGPLIAGTEWQACLVALEALDFDWLVLSGSLPRGVPDDFYIRAGDVARSRGARVVLDTSGPALARTLASGGIFLVKPSLGEFEQLMGTPLRDPDRLVAAARSLTAQGETAHLAVTMGHEGALLANADGILRLPAIAVAAQSAVGAGDSFVAAMTHALATGRSAHDAFRYGLAAGTAAVMTPGNDLCHRDDVERLFAQLTE
ncbi:1-phosphofructokinase family hexose kinase [Sphingobium sp. H39-3-25]|uniref:1-phosphofructokinase family hexose kinase n=1 Tax=Sphingobium arseniciresistens TaxID=3030834 RepID=UPI0023B8E90A|nr:1-phosphofructokinase family hexose kinase [Sphingobium arseniciresistens]